MSFECPVNSELWKRLDALVSARLFGELTESQVTELEQLLRENEEARNLYVELIEISVFLPRALACGKTEDDDRHAGRSGSGETANNGLIEAGDIAGRALHLPVPVLPAPPPSTHGVFAGAYRGAVSIFSREPALSLLIATVIYGLGLLLIFQLPFTHYQITPSPSPTGVDSSDPKGLAFEFVGRVTGMKDCRWADPETMTYVGSSVPLGRKYALSAGLMEITYGTGAKVILEGPCTYQVESRAGGYLALGKLTARIGERGAGRGERAKPQAANPQIPKSPNPQISGPSSLSPLPSPLFSVRTPTAVVTDLGTEFGVEVSKKGNTTSYVFRGRIELRVVEDKRPATTGAGEEPNRAIQLSAGESARVERDSAGVGLALTKTNEKAPVFVRRMADAATPVDPTNFVSGDVFQDDFNGAAVDADKWTVATSGGGTVAIADGMAIIRSELVPAKGISCLRSARPLDFASSPQDWWAEIKFKMDGELTSGSSGFSLVRDWIVLAGVSTAFGDWEMQGFDLRAMQRGAADGDSFDLGWWGWDNLHTERIPSALARNLHKGRFYMVAVHRKPDNTADVYLDGRLIAVKPLIASRNPVLLCCGDVSLLVGGQQVVDYVRVGPPAGKAPPAKEKNRKEGRPMEH